MFKETIEGSRLLAVAQSFVASHVHADFIVEGARCVLEAREVVSAHERTIRWDLIEGAAPPAKKIKVRVAAYCARYILSLGIVERSDTHIITRFIDTTYRERLRRMPRARIRQQIRLCAESAPMAFQDALCIEVSVGGIRCLLPNPPDDLAQGQAYRVFVRDEREGIVELACEVRRIHEHAGTMEVGFSVLASLPTMERWLNFINDRLHPTTATDMRAHEAIWDIYGVSGYLNLSGKTPAYFARLKESFVDVSEKLAKAPDIGCHVVWPSPRGIDATMSLIRFYQGTWMPLQLAKRPGRIFGNVLGRDILKSVHLRAFEHAVMHSDAQWFMSYVQRGTRFSKLIHADLPARHADGNRACLLPVHAFHCDVAKPIAPRDVFTVGAAQAHEIEALVTYLKAVKNPAYLGANDLTADAFDMHELENRWQQAGLRRERDVLVARRGGEAVAAAVVECVDDGLHLYDLANVIRLFAWDATGKAAYPALIEASRCWYASRQKGVFAYFSDAEDAPMAREYGLEDLGHAEMSIFSAELLPELLDHVVEMSAYKEVAPHSPADPTLAMVPDLGLEKSPRSVSHASRI